MKTVKSTEWFIAEATKKFGQTYDYTKVEYVGSQKNVRIICLIHGEFEQRPAEHLKSKVGCKRCSASVASISRKWTREAYIESCNKIHNDAYSYSEIHDEFVSGMIKIKCPTHGIFEQDSGDHRRGRGCRLCGIISSGKTRQMPPAVFLIKAGLVHRGRYLYDLSTIYDTQIRIVCPIHGEFFQSRNTHFSGCGCPKCSNWERKTKEYFVERIPKKFDKFDFSNMIFVNMTTKIRISCPAHGEFSQTPSRILSGIGCQKCSPSYKKTSDEFISAATAKHNGKYDYRNVVYKSTLEKVEIACPKHGAFFQKPNYHLSGNGCPCCQHTISKGETTWLDSLGISREIRQLRIPLLNGKKTSVDAFDELSNTVYEFFGDYYHGNPRSFSSSDYNKKVKKTFGDLYSNTLQKIKNIEDSGYTLVYIWEDEWEAISSHSFEFITDRDNDL